MNRAFYEDWLKGKTPEDFDLATARGRMYWPDKIQRMKTDGTYEEVKIRLLVLREPEELDALRDARAIFAERKLDPKEYPERFAKMETLARVARAMYEYEPKNSATKDGAPFFPRFQTLEILLSSDDTGISTNELLNLDDRLRLYAKLENPLREDAVDEQTAMVVAYAMVEVGNITPLAAFAGGSLDNCVLSMARALVRTLQNRLSGESLTPSTPAPTPRKKSR